MATQARFVWLHGFGSGPASAKAAYAAAQLAERGIPLETPDLNEPSFSELTVSRMLGRLDALWAERPAPLALIGSSLGGYVAALWSAAHPDRATAVALLAPAFDLAARWSARMGQPALDLWRAQGWYEFDHYARRHSERLSSRFLEDAALHPPFPLPQARTLVVQGARDETVPPELAREFARRMREAGRQVRLLELDEGHELTGNLPSLWQTLEAHFEPMLQPGARPRPTP